MAIADPRQWANVATFNNQETDARTVTNVRVPMTRGAYLETFRVLTEKMVETTTAKNNDYAGFDDPFANFREFGTFGFLVRMSDKWKRIKNLVGENRPPSVKDESVEDTLIDLATYCLLLLCWLRDQKNVG